MMGPIRAMNISHRWLVVVLLLAVGCQGLPFGGDPQERSRQQGLEALSTVGVIGASQSAGFGAGVSLGKVLRAGIRCPSRLVDGSNHLFFMRPLAVGQEQIEFLERHQVTVVVGLDYLFWYAYGTKSMAERKRHLEIGLDNLASIDCPIFVGDLPDMRGASKMMLPVASVPAVEEIEELNRRVLAWAGRHDNVVVLPLRDWVHAIKAGEPVLIDGAPRTVPPAEVFAVDRLHANREGQLIIGQMCLSALKERFPGLTDQDLVLRKLALEAGIRKKAAP